MSIQWHPVLDHFFTTFTKENPKAEGVRVEAIDGDWIGDTATLHEDWYRVCATKITIAVKNHIYFTGSGLLAGQSIHAKTSQIILEGQKDKPLLVVGIEGIQIEASSLSIKNVVFYVFDKINFSIRVTQRLALENVQLMKLGIIRADTTSLSTQQIVHWREKQLSSIPEPYQSENTFQDESALSIKFIEPTASSPTSDEESGTECKHMSSSVSRTPKRRDFWKSLVLGTLTVLSWASLLFLGYLWYKRGGHKFLKSLRSYCANFLSGASDHCACIRRE